jgi:hypothetical protein
VIISGLFKALGIALASFITN